MQLQGLGAQMGQANRYVQAQSKVPNQGGVQPTCMVLQARCEDVALWHETDSDQCNQCIPLLLVAAAVACQVHPISCL